jgi:hypothetical protein
MQPDFSDREREILAAYERGLNGQESVADRALLAEAARNSEIADILARLQGSQVRDARIKTLTQRLEHQRLEWLSRPQGRER